MASNGSSCLSNEVIGSELTCDIATKAMHSISMSYEGTSNTSDAPTGCYWSERGQKTYFNIFNDPSLTLVFKGDGGGICRRNGM